MNSHFILGFPIVQLNRVAGRVAALALVGLFAGGATAGEYWVSPRGSDRAAGSEGTPWRTLQSAANRVKAGDIVNVRAGHYQGMNVSKSGRSDARITFRAQPGAVIDRPLSFSGNYYGINASGQEYLTIEGFAFSPGNNDPAWFSAIRVGGRPDAWVKGIVVQHNDCMMRTVGRSGTPDLYGIYASWQDGLVVERNTVSGTFNSGMYVTNSAKNYTIRSNHVYDCGGNGIHNNGDVSQGGPGINSNALIENNIIHNTGFGIGGQAISCDGVQDSRIQNNLIYDAHAKGIALYATTSAGGCNRVVVVNNTVLTATDGGAALRIVARSGGNSVFNNILYSANPASASIDLLHGDLVGFRSDFNIVKDRFYVDGSKTSFREWQTNASQDRHSLTASPSQLFVKATAHNYRLCAGSSAIDAADVKMAPPTDIEGTSRPVGARPDVGAYEAKADAAPSAAPEGPRGEQPLSYGNLGITLVCGALLLAVWWLDDLIAAAFRLRRPQLTRSR
jgi:parallel beta-helix repeat protein